MKKEELLQELREHEAFKEILTSVSNENEKRLIKAHTENFILQFHKEVLEPLQKIVENNPEELHKYFSKIESELINSGSLNK